jgi:hypothetical protein
LYIWVSSAHKAAKVSSGDEDRKESRSQYASLVQPDNNDHSDNLSTNHITVTPMTVACGEEYDGQQNQMLLQTLDREGQYGCSCRGIVR